MHSTHKNEIVYKDAPDLKLDYQYQGSQDQSPTSTAFWLQL